MLQMHVSVFNVGVIWLCKNMESENSHLCQHPPAQCMHSHLHTRTQIHACSPCSLCHCHKAFCNDIDITTLCTGSAQEKGCWHNYFIFWERRKGEIITNSLLQGYLLMPNRCALLKNQCQSNTNVIFLIWLCCFWDIAGCFIVTQMK